MGTQLMSVCIKEENDEIPPVPPGFESFAAFTLKRISDGENQESQKRMTCSASASTSESQSAAQLEIESEIKAKKSTRPLRRRSCVNYGQLDHSSEDESDVGNLNPASLLQNQMVSQLPKGVIRGCPQCSNCQKVIARWSPENARMPVIEDAPVFFPTEEEFEDTLNYISSIRPKAEQYGICRIVPPPSWKPPCLLTEKTVWEDSKFTTRIQKVDKLQNRDSSRKNLKVNQNSRKKRRKCMRLGMGMGGLAENDGGCLDAERFGFEPGPEVTLSAFKKYADDFKAQYFGKNGDLANKEGMPHENWEPTVAEIEGEYWRIVEKATEEIEVLYGADVETGRYSSGFPKSSNQGDSSANEQYVKSGWNLNNFARLPGSVLSFESGDISGVLVPWLYVGMCFSSFCWHVEDHHLYSLNYNHLGAPKLWYGVPSKAATQFEDAMRRHLPDLFEEQPDLLHKLVTQFSPSILKSENVPVYHCVQNAGEFVLTFPRAYHSGFNCGFNCAEAVNVAPVDWFPHGLIAIEQYREQGRRTSISHDKLLLGAARAAVKAQWEIDILKRSTPDNLRWKGVCGKDGILAKAMKARVDMERVRRDFLCNSAQAFKMESNFDATSERECCICLFDLHLSAAGCRCSPDKYACLNHARQFCSCSQGAKFFLFRYDMAELHMLVEALEGKFSAVYRWAKLDLGLTLTSNVPKDKLEDAKLPKDKLQDAKLPEDILQDAKLPKDILQDAKLSSYTGKTVIIGLPADFKRRKGASKDISEVQNQTITSVEKVKPAEFLAWKGIPSNVSGTETFATEEKVKPAVLVQRKEIFKDVTVAKLQTVSLEEKPTEVLQAKGNPMTRTLIAASDKQVKPDGLLQGKGISWGATVTEAQANAPAYELKGSDSPSKDRKELIVCQDSFCVTNSKKDVPIPVTTNMVTPVYQYAPQEMSDDLEFTSVDDRLKKPLSSGPKDIILAFNEGDGLNKSVSERAKEICSTQLRCEDELSSADIKPCNNEKGLVSAGAVSLSLKSQNCTSFLPDAEKKTANPVVDKCEFQHSGIIMASSPPNSFSRAGGSAVKAVDTGDLSCVRTATMNHNATNVVTPDWSCATAKPYNEDKLESNGFSNSMDYSRSVAGSPSTSQNNLDRNFRQKGPRIAKVVRRINCNVEPLEFGVVLHGKAWSNSQTIFPKGFRSRVKYISILDPATMCYYISEIVDAGRNQPLFMVSPEQCSSEVFVHVSAARCWDMVRERVNQEISRQHKLGNPNLPPLQPPGSLDGLEMFGFSSPAIVQGIEALDRNRVCTGYWDSRPYSRPQVQIPQHFEQNLGRPNDINSRGTTNHLQPSGAQTLLRGLLKKANQEELHLLSRMLIDSSSTADRGLITQVLNEEFRSRPS